MERMAASRVSALANRCPNCTAHAQRTAQQQGWILAQVMGGRTPKGGMDAKAHSQAARGGGLPGHQADSKEMGKEAALVKALLY